MKTPMKSWKAETLQVRRRNLITLGSEITLVSVSSVQRLDALGRPRQRIRDGEEVRRSESERQSVGGRERQRSNGRTDGRMDGRTDGRTLRRTRGKVCRAKPWLLTQCVYSLRKGCAWGGVQTDGRWDRVKEAA